MTETSETFTNRTRELAEVEKVADDGLITFMGGWNFHPPVKLEAGKTYMFEFHGRGTIGRPIVGIGKITQEGMNWTDPLSSVSWLYRKTDQELETEHQALRDRINQERQERLDAHREAWTVRENDLPEPLRARLENFRRHGGEYFDREGWGYELVVCELAAMYAESGGKESDLISFYARAEGTSGNQHEYAKALARMMTTEPEKCAETVAALAPLTGNAFYDPEE